MYYASSATQISPSRPSPSGRLDQRPRSLDKRDGSLKYRGKKSEILDGHTEMFYITSISWRSDAQNSHCHIDDVLFLAFGVEDIRSGATDVWRATCSKIWRYVSRSSLESLHCTICHDCAVVTSTEIGTATRSVDSHRWTPARKTLSFAGRYLF